jgi:hypothetical protein
MLLKHKILILLALLLLCNGYSNIASAQFWIRKDKKTSKYSKPKSSNTPKPVVKSKLNSEKPKKIRTVVYPKTVKKNRYRIDIMIPLYVDELVKNDKIAFKGKIPEKAQGGINFYEGIKLAVDTLTHLGYKMDVYVHDVSAAESSVEKLLSKDSLHNSDLIIGFVPGGQVALLAKYAQTKHINFVSAFSPSDANVKDNPYFLLLSPTLQTHCNFLLSKISGKYPKENIVIYHRNKVALDSTAYSYLTSDGELKQVKEVDCNTLPDSTKLTLLFDSVGTNVVIMPIMDNQYAESLLKQLNDNFPEFHFEIYGMPSWKAMISGKKAGAFDDNIDINLSAPYYFDPTVSSGQTLANRYKQLYSNKPNEMVYRGFETTYWFADLLHKYGTIFNEKVNDNGMAIFTPFDLKPKWDKDNNFYYNENKHLYIFHYQAGNVLVEQ